MCIHGLIIPPQGRVLFAVFSKFHSASGRSPFSDFSNVTSGHPKIRPTAKPYPLQGIQHPQPATYRASTINTGRPNHTRRQQPTSAPLSLHQPETKEHQPTPNHLAITSTQEPRSTRGHRSAATKLQSTKATTRNNHCTSSTPTRTNRPASYQSTAISSTEHPLRR
jgi:hypothetical protein